MKKIKVSNNVIRRMPRYLRKLDELDAQGIARVSSSELGNLLGLTPSQIRQDFSCFGEFGQQGYGYNVSALKEEISKILGTDRGYNAVLVGVGNIGRALMDNFCFSDWGCNLLSAFDVDKDIIGREINGVPIRSMDDFSGFLAENRVDLAVLAVPKQYALTVTDVLTENGIKAIWNFTNVDIAGPDSPLIVENLHFSDSLLSLSYYISERNDENAARAARLERQKAAKDKK